MLDRRVDVRDFGHFLRRAIGDELINQRIEGNTRFADEQVMCAMDSGDDGMVPVLCPPSAPLRQIWAN